MKNNIELLAPAGSMEALRAAVQNGADAVYLGGPAFNARMGAKNFTPEGLREAVRYCHARGVAVHLTLNTLASDRELPSAETCVADAARSGVDAFIVQDLGMLRLCRTVAPGIALHASTQMSIHSLYGVKMAASLGCTRAVLARELPERDIAAICKYSPIEIEVFTHGALCMCYSGQCYFSAVVGRRSGNRGQCAQPCRLPYGYGEFNPKQYPLSLRDNCLLTYIDRLRQLGVSSLKLEGRMKRPEYVAIVTRIYRAALDGREVKKSDLRELEQVFSRQGFTDGYFRGETGPKMFGVRGEARGDAALLARARATYSGVEKRRVNTQIVPSVPELRAFEPFPRKKGTKRPPVPSVQVRTWQQVTDSVLELKPAVLYIPLSELAARPERVRDLPVSIAAVLPRVVWDSETEKIKQQLDGVRNLGVSDALCGNLGQISLLTEHGFRVRGDFGLNVFNSETAGELQRLGLISLTASFELRDAQLRDLSKPLPAELIGYGRLPLMLTENCILKNRNGKCACKGPGLVDRTGAVFPLLPDPGSCRTMIYNCKILNLLDKRDKLSGLWALRLMFTTERPEEVDRAVGLWKNKGPFDEKTQTRGLFTRGVE